MAIKIAVTYEKGGVGKTTTAVNLSAIFAEQGYRVLLVDLDYQSHATHYFNLYNDSKPSIFEVMQNCTKIQEAIRPTDFEDLYLLPSKLSFKMIETILMSMTAQQEYTLKKVLEPIENDYDFILIDCPANGDRIKTNAFAASDYLILPTIPDEYAIHGLWNISTSIAEIKRYTNPKLEVLGLLFVLCENTKNKKAYKEALEKEQDLFSCFNSSIRKNTKLSEAVNAHQPINIYDKQCNGFYDYKNLADEIFKKLGFLTDKDIENFSKMRII